MNWWAIVVIGAAVGLLGGFFGKGGSAVATPLLAAVGVPAIVAVASPLPATIPGTLVAYRRFRGGGFGDSRIVRLSVITGIPATLAGAVLTRWVGGPALVTITEIIVLLLGVRILLRRQPEGDSEGLRSDATHRVVVVAVVVGFFAGLLANAGGFLLVPLYLAVLRLPIKDALACSLAVAAVLAVPGTAVHAALGHIDWRVAIVFGIASVPSSSIGARLAVRIDSTRLERIYGAGLTILGAVLLVAR